MDIQMPEMDGFQATAKLRSEPRFRALPIIAMTAHATLEERQGCLAAGMNEHISKPIDPQMLFGTVGRFYKPTQDGRQVSVNPEVARDGGTVPNLPGLDREDGLFRVAGNRKLYLKLLRDFEQQQAEVPAQVAAALAGHDQEAAERLVHTLRGVAGNIGAKSVHVAAGQLEKLVRNGAGADELESAQADLASVLDSLLAELRNAFQTLTPETPRKSEPAPQSAKGTGFPDMLEHLESLLAQFDPSAVDFLEANESCLRPYFEKEAWEKLVDEATAYAFRECEILVGKALQEARAEIVRTAHS
jgi:two-component system sensor histidine kinase/response regulator